MSKNLVFFLRLPTLQPEDSRVLALPILSIFIGLSNKGLFSLKDGMSKKVQITLLNKKGTSTISKGTIFRLVHISSQHPQRQAYAPHKTIN